MQSHRNDQTKEAGFSLVELLVAMGVTLTLLAVSSALLAASFNVRARENQRSDALADAQRALNFMSRDIANAGFGLNNNGVVAADSNDKAIRVRANLNAYMAQTTSDSVADPDEDVQYRLVSEGGNSYLVRLDVNTNNQTTILANRIDNFLIRYYPDRVTYTPVAGGCDVDTGGVAEVTQKGAARYVVMVLCVTLPARGTPGVSGYQPPSRVRLISDVVLRNSDLISY